jgi:hypothetical protein
MVRGLASDGQYMVAVGTDPNSGISYASQYEYTSSRWLAPAPLLSIPAGTNVGAINYVNGFYLATAGSTSQRGDYSFGYDQRWYTTGTIGFGTKAAVYGPAGGVQGNLYIVAGQDGKAAYASSLINNFTVIPAGQFGTGWTGTGPVAYINAGAYGNDIYVFGGGGGRLAYTTNILNSSGQIVPWTQVTGANNPFASADFINVIVYGNGIFVAAAEIVHGANVSTGALAYSTNGITWTVTDLSDCDIGSNGIFALAYGNGYFAAADDDGNIAYSTDGIAWIGANNEDIFDASPRVNAMTYLAGEDGELAHFFVGGQNNGGVQVGESN